MSTAAAAPTSTPKPPLAKRVVRILLGIILVMVLPIAIAGLVAGPLAAGAVATGVIAGLSGSVRAGWHRAARVVPLVGVLGLASALVGYGWGWVVVVGFVGLLAGAGLPAGYAPAVLYAGFVPVMIHASAGIRGATLAAVFAMLGGVVGVATGRRMGAKPETPAPVKWKGHEAAAAIVGMLLFAGGAAIAIGTGMPHGYWIPLTLVVVVPPMLQEDTRRGRKRLLGTAMAVILVIPLSLIPMPPWGFYLVGFALLVPALAIMQRSYTFYAFLEGAAVVMLVSAGNDVIGTDEARLAGTAIAIGLVAVTAVVVTWLARRLPPADVAPQAVGP